MEAVSDNLSSSGTFTDIEQPIMYMKKLLCKDSLINFRAHVNKRILYERADPNIKTLIDSLKEMILACIPRRARFYKNYR